MRFFLHFSTNVLELLPSKFARIIWFPSQYELSRLQIVEIPSVLFLTAYLSQTYSKLTI